MEYLPLRMKPCYKEYLWGGQRLAEAFGKDRLVSISAFDSKETEAFKGKAVIPEVKRHG